MCRNIYHVESNLFPDDRNKLYVIGNGFDLHNKIKSSYKDFENFVKTNYPEEYDSIPNLLGECTLWSEFEYALGEADVISIYDSANILNKIDYDHPTQSSAAFEDTPPLELDANLMAIDEIFNDWVNKIEIPVKGNSDLFSAPGLFLTFNYTNTLEKSYNIPAEYVKHIHGTLDTKVIYGHGKIYDSPEGDMSFEDAAYEKITDILNTLRKPVEQIIDDNLEYWESLKQADIKDIVVIGHSLSNVDMPYFEKIKQILPDANWRFSFHDIKEKLKIKSFADNLGINKVKTFRLY